MDIYMQQQGQSPPMDLPIQWLEVTAWQSVNACHLPDSQFQ